MSLSYPIPENELQRILALSEFDLDYLALKDDFNGLAQLAAQVAGTPMSHINLIDTFNQWTIGDFGLPADITPREKTVCQYTIMQDEHFEVKDLLTDERFKEMGFVKGEPLLRYYYGIPLKSKGLNIGSLCVLDKEVNHLSNDVSRLLNIIAHDIVRRLQARRTIDLMGERYVTLRKNHMMLAHDIRGPVGGVMGLANIINDQGFENNLEEVLKFTRLMEKSCNSILELVNDILLNIEKDKNINLELTLSAFKEKLLQLYQPQAKNKNISFNVELLDKNEELIIPRNKLLQITGNLISNAIKFTQDGGIVTIHLNVITEEKQLIILVKDSGKGMSQERINSILNGKGITTFGTAGEQGFGLGLNLVKNLIEELSGTFTIKSIIENGSEFEVKLPYAIEKNGQDKVY